MEIEQLYKKRNILIIEEGIAWGKYKNWIDRRIGHFSCVRNYYYKQIELEKLNKIIAKKRA